MPTPKRPATRPSSHLLAHLAPTFSSPVHFSSTPFARHPRHLQLRASYLILLRAPTAPLAAADLILPLSANAAPVAHGPASVALPRHARKLHFPTPAARDAFLAAAAHAIRAAGAEDRIHEYDILARLASGATATVYRVRRRCDGRLFALKAVSKAYAFLSDSHLENVSRERVALAKAAEAGARFVVTLVDAFETSQHLCFVTELAAAGDLGDVIARKGGKVEEQDAKTLFAQMVAGLQETHEMGYLYRDVKPANMLVGADGNLKLGDLGLVKKVEKRVDSDRDSGSESEEGRSWRLVGRSESFVGTRKFMAPEVVRARRGKGYGAAADVWALGVTLFVMVTGRYPVGGGIEKGDWIRLREAIEEEEIRFPQGEIGELLEGMLDRDALERWDLDEVKRSEWLSEIDWDEIGKGKGVEVEVREGGEAVTEIDGESSVFDDMTLLGFEYSA